MRLAKAGYWGGDPEAVSRASLTAVLDALQYEIFCDEYNAVEYEMNK